MDNERERIRREIFDKPKEVIQEQPSIPVEGSRDIEIGPEVNPELLKMFPPKRLARIMKRELRRYGQAQKKKWSRWFEAVSK